MTVEQREKIRLRRLYDQIITRNIKQGWPYPLYRALADIEFTKVSGLGERLDNLERSVRELKGK